jgi:hypothetical protein
MCDGEKDRMCCASPSPTTITGIVVVESQSDNNDYYRIEIFFFVSNGATNISSQFFSSLRFSSPRHQITKFSLMEPLHQDWWGWKHVDGRRVEYKKV